MAIHGLVLLTPTDTDNTTGTVSIGANGQVTFTTVPDLRINGVFSTLYKNYMIVMNCVTSASTTIRVRLASADTDADTSVYNYKAFNADNVTVTSTATTAQTSGILCDTAASEYNGIIAHIYGPYDSTSSVGTTAIRSLVATSSGGANQKDYASSHILVGAYDSISLYPATGTMTGTLQVYGWRF